MSLITTAIPQQSFEVLGALIGSIIKTELTAQIALQTDTDVKRILNKTKVFSEIFHPFNESEMIAVNVFYFNGDYDNKQQLSNRGNYMFFIDIVGNAATTNRGDGDTINALQLQRIAGMIRAILESPKYKTLTQPYTIVNHTSVKSLKRTEEHDGTDSGNLIMYRLVFNVKATETTDFDVPTQWAKSYTNVSLEGTSKGFEYILEP